MFKNTGQINPDWSLRNCPNCDENISNSSREVCSKMPAELLSYIEVKEHFVGLRKDQIFFSYYRCNNCQTLYCPWYFNSNQLTDLYTNMPDNLMGEAKDNAEKTHKGYVKWAFKNTSLETNSLSYLEIGPDIGLVSAQVDILFTPTSSLLIEPNRGVHEELSKSMQNCKDVSISEELKSSRKFDLIFGVHVIDHLLNPKVFIESLLQNSNINTEFIIVVHNEKSLLRKVLKKKWPPFCLQHPQLFNPTTLRSLLKNSGWNLILYSKTSNWFGVQNISMHLATIIGLKKLLPKRLPNFTLPIRLGNFISKSRIN